MKIYAMMFDNQIKYIGLDREAVQSVVNNQLKSFGSKKATKQFRDGMPKVWLAEMEPIPTPVPAERARDEKGRFIKNVYA